MLGRSATINRSGAASATLRARPRRRPRPRLLVRRALALGCLAALLVGVYQLWFRDSSLVAVKTVHVEGVPASVAGADAIEQALTEAGRRMTTLHVREGLLRDAVRGIPLVGAVSADASFPSTLTVRVHLRRPAAIVDLGEGDVAIAGDGTVLRGLPVDGLGQLPRLAISGEAGGSRLRGTDLAQARVLGAAPASLRRYAEESSADSSGVEVRLAGGVELQFGTSSRAAEKWRAAAAVLSDSDLGPLDYVDLSAPRRPAVGGISYAPPPLGGG